MTVTPELSRSSPFTDGPTIPEDAIKVEAGRPRARPAAGPRLPWYMVDLSTPLTFPLGMTLSYALLASLGLKQDWPWWAWIIWAGGLGACWEGYVRRRRGRSATARAEGGDPR